MSALLIAVQAINAKQSAAVNVDVMAGASSGALTAVIAAAALLTGCDPVDPLRRAWVSEPTLDSLRGVDVRTPLSLEKARAVGHTVLSAMLGSGQGVTDKMREQRGLRAQGSSVQLEFALTCLRGFTYEIRQQDERQHDEREHDERMTTATSHLDWVQETLTAADVASVTRKWSFLLDAAIASASLPVMFPPTLLSRSRETYMQRSHEITNLPEVEREGMVVPVDPLSLWYIDGGFVNREPLGRCIRAARDRDAQPDANCPDDRLVLAIRPCPDKAPAAKDPAWTGEAGPPRWRSTLGHALRALVTHSICEDLRGVESTNGQLAAEAELRNALHNVLADPKASALTRPALVTAARGIRLARAGRARDEKDEQLDREVNGLSNDGLIKEVLDAATGLSNKRQIAIEVVGPSSGADVSGAAVGFVSERLRATDFLAGYQSMLCWMQDGLKRHGVAEAEIGIGAARARAATIPGWIGAFPIGRRPPPRLSAKLLRLGARTARAGLTNPRAD
jgi:predicted acylesterase/phospholipase RssA